MGFEVWVSRLGFRGKDFDFGFRGLDLGFRACLEIPPLHPLESVGHVSHVARRLNNGENVLLVKPGPGGKKWEIPSEIASLGYSV